MQSLRRWVSKVVGAPSLAGMFSGGELRSSQQLTAARQYPPNWRTQAVERQYAVMVAAMPALGKLGFIPASLPETNQGDGWGVLPTIPALGRVLGIDNPYRNYHLILGQVLQALHNQRVFWSPYYSAGSALTRQTVWIERSVLEVYQAYDSQMNNNPCFVWPVSLGNDFKYQLPEVVLPLALGKGALPLCSVHTGLLLLSNPGRMTRARDLWIDNAGDEGPGDGSGFSHSFFRYSEGATTGGELRFNIDGSVPQSSGTAVAYPAAL